MAGGVRLALLLYCGVLLWALVFLCAAPAFATGKPYEAEEVSWRSGNATIHGTLLMPEGEGPHPAVVFVHGSGAATRSSFMAQPGMRGEGIAESFAKAGIAALVYDKRSSGESTGERSYAYGDLARDALGGSGSCAAGKTWTPPRWACGASARADGSSPWRPPIRRR